jgi:hypothetical protein
MRETPLLFTAKPGYSPTDPDSSELTQQSSLSLLIVLMRVKKEFFCEAFCIVIIR